MRNYNKCKKCGKFLLYELTNTDEFTANCCNEEYKIYNESEWKIY